MMNKKCSGQTFTDTSTDTSTTDTSTTDTSIDTSTTDTPDEICNCTCTQTCVDVWMQCGGDEIRSSTENCCEGATCVQYNTWYAQCVPT